MKARLRKRLQDAKWFFLEKINWCHPTDRDGNEKPQTWFYKAYCLAFWPIPWMEPQPCWCCASVRGLAYGLVLGLIVGGLLF